MKKKLLIVYQSMMLGGSTTSLIAFIKNLDFDKFDVDLQLFENRGPFMKYIPENVNLLPQAKKHKSKISKCLSFLISGYFFKALFSKFKLRRFSLSPSVKGEFMAKKGSKKNNKHYDYAIGFLEGWSDRYIAFCVKADKKYAWLHSTFANITPIPDAEIPWMKRVDKIIFVTDACLEEFNKTMPQMAHKAITVENITDSSLVKKRGEEIPQNDSDYERFVSSEKFKIITVCRIDIRTKGIDRILNAANRLRESGCEFLWYIIGDGLDAAALSSDIVEKQLSDHVIPIGIRMNPYPFIKAADIMCMPSRYEGKPMVITESMILGTPPVVTKYFSAEEQIQNGIEGIIVENQDDSIFTPLSELILDREKLDYLTENLFSRDYGNKNYMSVIEKTLFS